MIKLIDNEGFGFAEGEYKNKNEVRFRCFEFARQDNILTETDLRKVTFEDCLDIWNFSFEGQDE